MGTKKKFCKYNKTICLVAHLYPINETDYKGGFVRDLAVALCHKGCNVHIVTPMRFNALKEEKISGNLHIHRFTYMGAGKGIQLGQLKGTPLLLLGTLVLSGIIKCIGVVIKYRADIIHAYWVVPGGLIAMAAGLMTNRPVIATAAGSDLNIASRNKIYKILIRLTLKGIDKLIAVSGAMKNLSLSMGLCEQKVVVFPGPVGIDIDLYKNSNPSFMPDNFLNDNTRKNRQILYVGNLTYPKRVDTILRAMKIVAENINDVHLIIAGDGNQRTELADLAEDLGIKDKVIFKGAVPHDKIAEYMHHAYAFVHCSENEGLPVAIMEAMASGLPVIGSQVGGIPELISDNETGYILHYDDYRSYADKIIVLLKNNTLRNQMGKKGRKFAIQNFNKKDIIIKNIEVYKSVMTEKTEYKKQNSKVVSFL